MLDFQRTAKPANPIIVLEGHFRAIQMPQDSVLPAYFLRDPSDNRGQTLLHTVKDPREIRYVVIRIV